MNYRILTVLVAGSLLLAGCKDKPANIKLESLESKVSYAIGMSVGDNIKQADFPIDVAAFQAGVADQLADGELRMTEAEAQEAFAAFQEQQQAKQAAELAARAEQEQAKSAAFLTEYAQRDGVTKTDSGLLYRVLTAGSGAIPTAEDMVTVHYRGTLIDGTEFDSSYAREEPANFPIPAVIPGWVEALQLMSVGSKWELVIPAELAYGEQGGGPIPPNATLVFEVELLGIGPAEVTAGQP